MLTANVSRACEVAKIGAEYSPLPQTNLVKKDILLPENQQFRMHAVTCWHIISLLFRLCPKCNQTGLEFLLLSRPKIALLVLSKL